jgi:chromosome transmission fidelity protein 4
VKPPASALSNTIPVKRKPTPPLFGDDPVDSGGHDVDLDAALGLDNDDWIIDDVGMLNEDDDKGKRSGDGFVREMGWCFKFVEYYQR